MTIEQVNQAMISGQLIKHTYNGSAPIKYRIGGVITRYSKDKGWTYSLELRDLKNGCVVIAAMKDCVVIAAMKDCEVVE